MADPIRAIADRNIDTDRRLRAVESGSSVRLTLAAREGNFKNVKDFGALGIGLDDRIGIQAAHDAAGIGGHVYYPTPPVAYTIGSFTDTTLKIGVTFPVDQSFGGDGSGKTIIRAADNLPNYLALYATVNPFGPSGYSNLSVKGITFDQNAANNPLVLPAGAFPRCVFYVSSFDVDSHMEFEDVLFDNSDSINAAYLTTGNYIGRNVRTRNYGGPVTTALHDASAIYVTIISDTGHQIHSDCFGHATLGSGGAVTFIETHCGSTVLWNVNTEGFMCAANLTSIGTAATPGITWIGGQVNNCALAVQLWAQAGDEIGNVYLEGITANIDRETWLGVAGLSLPSCAFKLAFTGACEVFGLTLKNIVANYLPFTTMTGDDDDSVGFSLIASTSTIHDLFLDDCTVKNSPSAGAFFNTIVETGRLRNFVVTDPRTSTDASATVVHGAAALMFGTYTDFWYDGVGVVDTRGTARAGFCVYHAATAWTRGGSRGGNYISLYSGAASNCPVYPASNSIATLRIDETSALGQVPFFDTFPGSIVCNPLTGEVKRQVTATKGTVWISEFWGVGTPEGVVTAPVGSFFHRQNGAAGTWLYVKATGAGNTGWVASL